MSNKEWQQYQLYDGTYCLEDLLDWHEMNDVRCENQKRFEDAMKRQIAINRGGK